MREKYERLKFPVVSEEFPSDSIPHDGQNNVSRRCRRRARARVELREAYSAKFRCFLRARLAPRPSRPDDDKNVRVEKRRGEKMKKKRRKKGTSTLELRQFLSRFAARFEIIALVSCLASCFPPFRRTSRVPNSALPHAKVGPPTAVRPRTRYKVYRYLGRSTYRARVQRPYSSRVLKR